MRTGLIVILCLVGCAKPQMGATAFVETKNFCLENPTTTEPHNWRNPYNFTEGHGYVTTCYQDEGRAVQTRWCTEFCHHPLCNNWGSDKKCSEWNWDANEDWAVDLKDFACIQNTATVNCCRFHKLGGVSPCP